MDSNEPVALPSGRNDSGKPADPTMQPTSQSILHPDRIAKNTSYLTIALIIQKVLSLGYFIYISRSVGPENIGSYLTALAITTVLGFFIDLNFSQATIREIAKRPEKTSDYINAALSVKVITALLAYTLAQLYVHAFHLPTIVQSLVLITGLIMILDSLTLSFYSALRGHQRLKYESLGTVLNKILVTIIGVVGLSLGYNVHLLVIAIGIGSIFNIFYSGTLVIKKLHWRPALFSKIADIRFLARIVLPWFALGGIFVTVYGYIDQVLLTNPLLVGERGSSYLSWYGTAYKLTFSFQFLPAAVVAAFFPAMSHYYITNRERLRTTFERAVSYLIIISVPLSLGILALADKIIVAAYTKVFSASIIPLQILIISLLFVFLNYPAGYLLFAADRIRRNTIHVGIVMVINIILNLILIPRFTFIGAAIASSCSSVLLVILNMAVARQIIAFRLRAVFLVAGKSLFAAGSMAIGLWLLKEQLGVLTLIPFAVVWYFVALFLVKGFTISDGVSMYRMVMRKVSPHNKHGA